MTLGEKLRKARLDKGMTQTQVAGTRITRNMLSQLENDAASPSIKTLEYLAEVLDIPVGWLLETHPQEDRLALLDRARERYRLGDYRGCAALLPPESHMGEEEKLLLIRSLLAWAGQCLEKNHLREAAQIAEQAESLCMDSLYAGNQERAEAAYVLASCALAQEQSPWDAFGRFVHACEALQLSSRGSLLRAELMLAEGDTDAAERALWAASELTDHLLTQQLILRGVLEMQRGDLAQAIIYLQQAEQQNRISVKQRKEIYRRLELCCREMEDYKQAYHYSVLQLELERKDG